MDTDLPVGRGIVAEELCLVLNLFPFDVMLFKDALYLLHTRHRLKPFTLLNCLRKRRSTDEQDRSGGNGNRK